MTYGTSLGAFTKTDYRNQHDSAFSNDEWLLLLRVNSIMHLTVSLVLQVIHKHYGEQTQVQSATLWAALLASEVADSLSQLNDSPPNYWLFIYPGPSSFSPFDNDSSFHTYGNCLSCKSHCFLCSADSKCLTNPALYSKPNVTNAKFYRSESLPG